MTWGTLEEEVVECFQRPQWQCGAAKVAASRVRESWIPRRKKHNCSSTTWEGSMEQAPSKHSRGPGEPFMCGSPPSFAPRGRGHILITKRSPNKIACIINEWEKDSCMCCLLYQALLGNRSCAVLHPLADMLARRRGVKPRSMIDGSQIRSWHRWTTNPTTPRRG